MVFCGDSRAIRGLDDILRKAVLREGSGNGKWAPTQDGACGLVNHRIVLLEPGKSQHREM